MSYEEYLERSKKVTNQKIKNWELKSNIWGWFSRFGTWKKFQDFVVEYRWLWKWEPYVWKSWKTKLRYPDSWWLTSWVLVEAKAWYVSSKIDRFQLEDYIDFASENWSTLEYYFKSKAWVENNLNLFTSLINKYSEKVENFDKNKVSIYYFDEVKNKLLKYNY